ncbi:MAG: hypothetical protein H0W81_04790 [Chloroflexi bacterium]|nr:hypothetical protein [Chloroflexota bacterium]
MDYRRIIRVAAIIALLVTTVAQSPAEAVIGSGTRDVGATFPEVASIHTIERAASTGTNSVTSQLRFEPTPKLLLPNYLSTITDPVWKAQITRITDHAGVRHTYSRRQAWNHDGSLLLVGMGAGKPRMLLDGRTYKVLNPAVGGDGLWSETDPGLLIRTDSRTGEVFTFNPLTNRKTSTIVNLAEFNYGSQLETMAQSSLDDNGRFLLLYGATATARKKVIVLDMATRSIRTLDVATRPHAGSLSHSGRYVALNWDADGSPREHGIWLFDSNLRPVRQIATSEAHSDFAYDTAGREVLVWIGALGSVRMHRLADGVVTLALNGGSAMKRGHISGRNSDRPGWIYCSIYDSVATKGLVGSDQIFALKLDGSQIVEVFAHAHHAADSYYRNPMASVSRDGRRVLFASEWGQSDVYEYVATQP